MHSFIRFSIVGVFALLGIAFAVGLAITSTPPADGNGAAADSHPAAESVDPSEERNVNEPGELTLREPYSPIIAPYRDPVAERIGEIPYYEPDTDLRGGPPLTALNEPQNVAPIRLAQNDLPRRGGASNGVANVLTDEGDGLLEVNVQGEDIRKVLDLLAQAGGINILASKNVQGTVSASLVNVDAATALEVILRNNGYVAKRDGQFVFVGTPDDFIAMEQTMDSVGTRVYRPNYVTAAELQALVSPMLTPEIGMMSVSSASEVGIAPDASSAGGDAFPNNEVLLVRDYEAVLAQVDQVIEEVDRRPLQVAIEAMIVSVKLDDSNKLGVNFELLRDKNNIRVISGTLPTTLASIAADGGLKVGFLDTSLQVFVEALETIGDANVIASPRLMCLNKQRAEIHIGRELGYISTTVTENAATQSVEFLETGTQLRIRPFISPDGLIRMEVHPELSTGAVGLVGGFTVPDKDVTQVTTNVMVRDGSTMVLGGLIREDLKKTASQVPMLGSLPGAGLLFRQKTDELDRQEIIILITPRVIDDAQSAHEGDRAAYEFQNRHTNYRDKMSPIGTRYYGRKYLRLATAAWLDGDAFKALRYVNLAVHYDPLSREASALRSEIVNNSPYGDNSVHRRLHVGLSPLGHPVIPPRSTPEVLHQLSNPGPGAPVVPRPLDRGIPGASREISRPTLP
jgi:type IV pilus assembly protein PilQ